MKDNNKKTLLVVDDEQVFCNTVQEYLASDTLDVLAAHTKAEGIDICSNRKVDVVLLDQKLPDGEGHELATMILEGNEQAKIIFITAFPSFENAVKAVRTGAHDYLSKPIDSEELKLSVTGALRMQDLEKVEQVHRYEKEKEKQESIIVGDHGGLVDIERLVESAAKNEAPVLITGETGTGKNLIAKAIHYRSRLSKAPFISINCAALPEQLIEAELFGFERGAFTGAVSSKKGLFEMAEGGTLFLDEIGEMPMHLQTKLLSALDERTIRRLGSTAPKKVNVRIIAATNSEIEKNLGATFRKDLYYRLSVVRIELPPLRDRLGDIPELCAYLYKTLAPGIEVDVSEGEFAKLQRYDWPGNVRELRNVLERSLFLHDGGKLRPSLLIETREPKPAAIEPQKSSASAVRTLMEAERETIACDLEYCNGNLTQTAKTLGVSLSTLKRKLKEYQLR